MAAVSTIKLGTLAIVLGMTLVCQLTVFAQRRIRSLIIEERPAALLRSPVWKPFVRMTAVAVPQELIRQELLFQEGEYSALAKLRAMPASERALLHTGLFDTVAIALRHLNDNESDAIISMQNRINLAPYAIVESGGGVATFGAGVDAVNVLGQGLAVQGSVRYQEENALGWQADLVLEQWRLPFATDVSAWLRLSANRVRSEQELRLYQPYLWQQDWYVGLAAYNATGGEFIYAQANDGKTSSAAALMPSAERWLQGFVSVRGQYWETDFRLTASAKIQSAERAESRLYRFSDNTTQAFLALDAQSRTTSFQAAPAHLPELLKHLPVREAAAFCTGAFGGATVGFFADNTGKRGITEIYSLWAAGSVFADRNTYLFGSVFLYGRIGSEQWQPNSNHHGLVSGIDALLKFNVFVNSSITLALQADISSPPFVGFRQLTADTFTGLRGYAPNALAGYRRFVWNAELRGIPIAVVGQYALSGTLFWDAVLIQSGNWGLSGLSGLLPSAPPVNAVLTSGQSFGAGVRLHYPSLTGRTSVVRVDVAYNSTLQRVAQVVISTQEAFPLFGSHQETLPELWRERVEQ